MFRLDPSEIEGGISADVLRLMIAAHGREVYRLSKLEDYYNGRQKILSRVQSNQTAPNNRLANGFAKYITDTAIGYCFGNPITYLSGGTDLKDLKDTLRAADADTHDSELAKDLSVYGVGFELAYMSAGVEPRLKFALIDPKAAFMVYSDMIEDEPLFGVYYFKRMDARGEFKGYVINVYTKEETLEYFSRDLSNFALVSRLPHYLGALPLIQYFNNEEGKGDFENVTSLIDAYDILQSDRMNDKERFVNAILVIANAMIDDEGETLKHMKSLGILQIPGGEGANAVTVSYLTKTLNEAETEILKKALAADIHKFSQTPDFTDEMFSGNTSGVAIRFKLLSLEYLAKIKERFFVSGLRERLGLIRNVLYKTGKTLFDVADVQIVFNRTLPINELENAQMLATYAGAGLVSKETLLSQVSFVKDVEKEMNN